MRLKHILTQTAGRGINQRWKSLIFQKENIFLCWFRMQIFHGENDDEESREEGMINASIIVI